MAKITFESLGESSSVNQINQWLAPLNITLAHWSLSENQQAMNLLQHDALKVEEKETLLQYFEHYFKALQAKLGYQSRDLIVIHPHLEGLGAMLNKFNSPHTHDDDEVRYIIDGEGIFGFALPDGKQAELLVEAGDYINVPRGTDHWFHLTSKKRIKAIRYFSGTSGWVPKYTETRIKDELFAVSSLNSA